MRRVYPPPHRIFISHAHADSDMALGLANDLRARGLDAWVDLHGLRAGESWADVIRTQLDEADAFVLLIGADSQYSPWARREMSEILKRAWADDSKIVLPVLIGSAEPPGYLRDQVTLRIEPKSFSGDWDALLHHLTEQPGPRGIHRTEAGETRLDRRLAELQRAAASMAADDEEA